MLLSQPPWSPFPITKRTPIVIVPFTRPSWAISFWLKHSPRWDLCQSAPRPPNWIQVRLCYYELSYSLSISLGFGFTYRSWKKCAARQRDAASLICTPLIRVNKKGRVVFITLLIQGSISWRGGGVVGKHASEWRCCSRFRSKPTFSFTWMRAHVSRKRIAVHHFFFYVLQK